MSEYLKSRTYFLFSSPSFWSSLGSIFNIAGSYYEYNFSKTPAEADKKALQSDWSILNQDFKNAAMEFRDLHLNK